MALAQIITDAGPVETFSKWTMRRGAPSMESYLGLHAHLSRPLESVLGHRTAVKLFFDASVIPSSAMGGDH